ncbi:UNVERIFIED_CONTAM: putative sugar phosphate/phosphate translocator [Sesamum radiatum]|uniref:Sugar phosphate/phosphate translocator n=1 Tax=Sesamum radiatum TaxID=300843 RepID=A0AAW2NNC0_SESRA
MVIVYNKYILDPKMYNWPYPISLTMIHMAFCSSLAYILVRILKVVDPVTMSWDLYVKSVIPIGLLYSLSLWLSNSAYIYLSVSFIQMLKALMPVAVYTIGVMFKKESFKSETMANMISISIGVAIAAYGEAKFDSMGVVLQLGAVAFEATRLVMIQILLTSRGYGDSDQLTWLCIGVLGVGYYNHSKLQALKAKETQKKPDEESGMLLAEKNEESSGSKKNESQD